MNFLFDLKTIVKQVKCSFITNQLNSLKQECIDKPKLRTFVQFEDYSALHAYITKPLSFKQRKFLAKLRLGSLEIKIETGRFSRPRLEENERISICNQKN